MNFWSLERLQLQRWTLTSNSYLPTLVLFVTCLSPDHRVAQKESLLARGPWRRPQHEGDTINFIMGEVVSFIVVHPSRVVVLREILISRIVLVHSCEGSDCSSSGFLRLVGHTLTDEVGVRCYDRRILVFSGK